MKQFLYSFLYVLYTLVSVMILGLTIGSTFMVGMADAPWWIIPIGLFLSITIAASMPQVFQFFRDKDVL